MLFIFGKRVASAGRFTDNTHICYRCKSFDREVKFYQAYFHFCFIPLFPAGRQTVEMRCRSCGDDTRLESVLAEYQHKTTTPVLLWSGTVLFGLLITAWFFWHSGQQKQTAGFLAHPAPGDVYTIEEFSRDGSEYHFLLVAAVKNDSVFMLANKTVYGGFVSDLADDDYFVAGDTLAFASGKLAAMRADEEITRIRRGFGKGSSFTRIK